MKTNKNYKKFKSSLTLIFFAIVATICTNVTYATNNLQFKITKIVTYSRKIERNSKETSDIKFLDKGWYQLTFFVDKNQNPQPMEFNIIDSDNILHKGTELSPVDCRLTRPTDKFKSCTVKGFFKEKNNNLHHKNFYFNAEYGGKTEKNLEITENMPDLIPTLELEKSNQDSEKNYTLKLTNISLKPIRISDVAVEKEYEKHINISNAPNLIIIPSGNDHKITLTTNQDYSSSLCSEANDTKVFYIKITYKIENETPGNNLKNLVAIRLICETINKATSIATTPTLSLTQESYTDTLETNEGTDIQYTIENLSNNNATLHIGGFYPPIYRNNDMDMDMGLSKNCGDSLKPNQTCVVKLLIYPTELKDIEQTLSISSDTLKSNLVADIKIGVEKSTAALQIIPCTENTCNIRPLPQSTESQNQHSNTDLSTITVVNALSQSGQGTLEIPYKLLNNSKKILYFDKDSFQTGNCIYKDESFTVTANDCQSLQPDQTCLIKVIFTPGKTYDHSEKQGIKRAITVSYTQGDSNEKKFTKIPILININS